MRVYDEIRWLRRLDLGLSVSIDGPHLDDLTLPDLRHAVFFAEHRVDAGATNQPSGPDSPYILYIKLAF